MKKKLLTILLALCAATCLCFGLSACDLFGGDSGGNEQNTEQGGSSGDTGGGTEHTHVYNQQVAKDGKYLMTPATCTNRAVYYYSCICGAMGNETFEYGEALGHTEVSANNGKTATCTTAGKESDTICSVCRTTLTTGAEIPALGHDLQHHEAQAATCTEIGWDAYDTCSRCDYSTYEEISATGHKEALADNAVAATCTTAGKESDTICSVCRTTLTVGAAIPAKGHTYNETNHKCTVCGAYEAGLYDADYNLLATYEASGMDVTTDYTWSNSDTSETSPYYILTHTYTTAVNVVLPDGVTNIGEYAFFYCTSLKSVNIPDSVTSIGNSAFSVCTGEIKWGDNPSITEIGSYAFYGYKGTSITIPDGVTSIGQEAFYGCSSLTSITIPDSVTSIGSDAFSNTAYYNDESNWENDVLYIGKHLIKAKTSISSAEIKSDTLTIANYAFYNCTALTEINYNATECADLSSNNSVFSNAGQSGEGITVTIGANVKKIPTYLFFPYYKYGDNSSYSPKIVSVVFADNSQCESIGQSAFYGCTSLTSIEIPDGVTSIGNYAFEDCTSLESVTIPKNVASIGYYAFYNCTSLTEINYNATEYADLSSSNYVFHKAGQSGEGITVNIGANVKKIPAYLFSGVSKIVSVVFADNSQCTSIGYQAFYNCTSLESVTIGNSVTSIGYYAFYNCTALTEINYNATECADLSYKIGYNNYVFYNAGQSGDGITVNIGANVKKIPAYLFCPYDSSSTYSPKIVSVVFAENGVCESIRSWAFFYCTSLTSITIPDSVTGIGDWAFYNCTSLTSINIPDSVTSIGDAFSNTAYYNDESNWENDVLYIGKHLIEAKTSISGAYEIKSGTLTIASSAFYNCTKLTEITIPDSVTSIGSSAFEYCSSLTSITIPDGVTSIGYGAFYGCTSLTSITIPDGVTSIGSYAFRGCTSLKSITIPDGVTSIGDYAFYGCSSLTSVTFKNTSGWWVSTSSTATSGTNISSDDLANTSTAATYLTSTYRTYYWKRSES